MIASIGPQEAFIGLLVILVLFGGTQIPKLARNLGRAQKEFKQGFDEGTRSASTDDEKSADTADK